MREAIRRLTPDRLAWIGFTVFAVGLIVDSIWHATHSEFETALDQVQAHFVLGWGTVLVFVAALWALTTGRGRPGHVVLLVAAAGNAGIHGWHFWEHFQHRDPGLPHVLLLVTSVMILVGAVWVRLLAGTRRDEP